jgi:ribosomal protein L11 methyltransferase
MNNTLALKIDVEPKNPWVEILIAELSELNFDAFEETDSGLIAYGNENNINQNEIFNQTSLANSEINYQSSIELIPYQNWNENWEQNFEPVNIEDKISILAPFHDEKFKKDINIIIQPQTSFGTGHHQTTYLMAKAMIEINHIPKKVLDMGTGTGVLAILAEKIGSDEILAIDIEDWSVENAKENLKRNKCKKINCLCGTEELIKDNNFDLILANINKNVLKSQLPTYFSCLSHKGLLLLSGFFDSDAQELIEFSEKIGFSSDKKLEKETWAMLQFVKK